MPPAQILLVERESGMLVAVVLRRRGFQSPEMEEDLEIILSTHHCMAAGTEVGRGAVACPRSCRVTGRAAAGSSRALAPRLVLRPYGEWGESRLWGLEHSASDMTLPISDDGIFEHLWGANCLLSTAFNVLHALSPLLHVPTLEIGALINPGLLPLQGFPGRKLRHRGVRRLALSGPLVQGGARV